MNKSRGFTLIELLVVIAIIGLLASVVMASLNSARGKALDAKRASEMKSIQTALELYYMANNSYPNPGWGWRSQCPSWGGYAANQVIPGLVPTYLGTFPTDSQMNTSTNTCCYLYLSNGTDYTLLNHNCPTLNYNSVPSLIDSARDSGSNACAVDGTGIWAWAIRSSQTNACW